MMEMVNGLMHKRRIWVTAGFVRRVRVSSAPDLMASGSASRSMVVVGHFFTF
jgi:hypothetical protein